MIAALPAVFLSETYVVLLVKSFGTLTKVDMSNDFLRLYTIPTLHRTETVTEAQEVNVQPEQEVKSGISNYSRYLPPGKQLDNNEIPSSQPPNPRKRASSDAASTGNSEVKIPIFPGRDRSYPDELNLLINLLFCELCKVQLNSQKTATCHYESKAHDRKITAWLAERYPNNPPPVKRFIKEGPTGPEAFRCELCDLPLTSLAHAKQHYAGRKHRLVASQKSDPSGAGYYDAEGKWIRTATKKFGSNKNVDGRFGIGEDFVSDDTAVATASNEQQQSIPVVISPKPAASIDESLCCKICDIVVTSSTQMAMHLSGAKHKKKSATSEALVIPPVPPADTNSILATINEEVKPSEDISMYRTPTGSYYCPTCNISMNHATVLQQHILGKKHKIKAKTYQAKPESSTAQP